jgi:hypothetical protein
MRGWLALVVMLPLGCTGPDDDTAGTDDSEAPDDSDTDDVTDEGTDPQPFADEEALRALVAGERSLAEVRREVLGRGGFPVKTAAGTWLFVHEGQGDWSVAGSWDDWTLNAMTAGDGYLWAEVPIAEPDGALYKFVEDGTDYVADPLARRYDYDELGEISYVASPADVGHLERWLDVGPSGSDLSARELRLYVPAGAGPWPVLVVHDGQNLFDPEATFGYWQLADHVAEVGDILVVGIDNAGAARMDEYVQDEDRIDGTTYGGKGPDYAAFVIEDVVPLIADHYPTTDHLGVMGSSLGGLISLTIADLYPDDVDFVASMSGTLGWGKFELDNPVIEEAYVAAGVRDFVVYVDSGGSQGSDGGCFDPDDDGFPEDDPDDADNYCMNRHFADALAENGYTWDVDLIHWHEPGAGHNEAAWGARVERPLELFLSSAD